MAIVISRKSASCRAWGHKPVSTGTEEGNLSVSLCGLHIRPCPEKQNKVKTQKEKADERSRDLGKVREER